MLMVNYSRLTEFDGNVVRQYRSGITRSPEVTNQRIGWNDEFAPHFSKLSSDDGGKLLVAGADKLATQKRTNAAVNHLSAKPAGCPEMVVRLARRSQRRAIIRPEVLTT